MWPEECLQCIVTLAYDISTAKLSQPHPRHVTGGTPAEQQLQGAVLLLQCG